MVFDEENEGLKLIGCLCKRLRNAVFHEVPLVFIIGSPLLKVRMYSYDTCCHISQCFVILVIMYIDH